MKSISSTRGSLTVFYTVTVPVLIILLAILLSLLFTMHEHRQAVRNGYLDIYQTMLEYDRKLLNQYGIFGVEKQINTQTFSHSLGESESLKKAMLSSMSIKIQTDFVQKVNDYLVGKASKTKMRIHFDLSQIRKMERHRKLSLDHIEEEENLKAFKQLFRKYFYVYEVDFKNNIDLRFLSTLRYNTKIIDSLADTNEYLDKISRMPFAKDIVEKLLLVEYDLTYLGHTSTSSPRKELQSEYVLTGISNKYVSLYTVTKMVMALRMAINVIENTSESIGKIESADPRILAAKVILLSIKDTAVDMARLYTKKEVKMAGKLKGGYDDHLRILLLMVPESTIIDRTGKAIEKNSGLNLDTFFTNFSENVEFSKEIMFTNLIFDGSEDIDVGFYN